QCALPIGKVTDFALLADEIVGELRMEWVDHPRGELGDEEGEDLSERLFGGETATGDRVDVGPVDDGTHKGKAGGDESDVPESPPGPFLACGFEAQAHAQVFDLGGHLL